MLKPCQLPKIKHLSKIAFLDKMNASSMRFNRPVQLTRFNFLPLNKAQCCCLNELHLHFGHQMTRFQLLHHPEYYEENRCFDKFINKHSFRLYVMLNKW